MRASNMKKPSFSVFLIVLGIGFLTLFTVMPSLIDIRIFSPHSPVPMIILYSGWILLGSGIWKALSKRILLFARK
ncbi:hypothetical protein [Candidatus Nitrosopumilus salaria]|uniref:hypothetical protein n=1 Tax=Candidatus Nitrosopumilus salarius TaxID=1170320 RepID=UPI00064EAAA3|nr:hypothetical protein [Candidatus Nitrosopumilus salaria]